MNLEPPHVERTHTSRTLEGSCLCGTVTYRYQASPQQFHLCHCSLCRKVSGSAHASNIFVLPQHFEWLSGEDRWKRFDLPSGKWFSTAFCCECGSRVPWLSRDGKSLIIPAGTLDSCSSIEPQDNIFWEDRADWYDAALQAERVAKYPKPQESLESCTP